MDRKQELSAGEPGRFAAKAANFAGELEQLAGEQERTAKREHFAGARRLAGELPAMAAREFGARRGQARQVSGEARRSQAVGESEHASRPWQRASGVLEKGGTSWAGRGLSRNNPPSDHMLLGRLGIWLLDIWRGSRTPGLTGRRVHDRGGIGVHRCHCGILRLLALHGGWFGV